MFLKFDTFEERNNKFFNSMLTDLNSKIYKISTDRFVFMDKQLKLIGKVSSNAHVIVYINGVIASETDALGDGSFTVYIRLVNNENDIVVNYL